MKKIFYPLLILTLLYLPVAHAKLPPEFQVVYQLNKFGMNAAQATVSLKQREDGAWIYNSQTKTKGVISIFRKDAITEQTELKKIGQQFKPVEYQYIHKGSKKNRNRSIRFDWDSKLAYSEVSGKQASLNIKPDTIDSFYLQLKLMIDLMSGKRDLDYSIIRKGEVENYQFEILGEETIETSAGDFKALKLKRTRKDSKRTTIMWMSPALHFLPVKMKHIEKDGTEFSLLLDRLSGGLAGTEYKTDISTETE